MSFFRRRIGAAAMLASGLAGVALALWAFWFEPRRLVVNRFELRLPNWPTELDGLKIALLTDLHVGSPHWDLAALSVLVERTNAEHADLIVLTGDYQINGVKGGHFVESEPIAERLGALKAPLGVIAVLGNHDWWNDGERMRRALVARGITVLEESCLRLERGGAALYVIGLADQMTRESNPKAAMALAPRGAPTLVLVHEPDVFATFPGLSISPTLTLAGHTHGGQVKLPLLGRRIVPSAFGERYAYGHVVEEGRHLFVSSGIGTSIFPVRFGVPPEIALLVCRRSNGVDD